MVTSTGYIPNREITTWRRIGSANSPGKGRHAEMQVWDGRPQDAANVYMFEQDGVLCENCHPFFREYSRTHRVSFIFCVTRAGYAIQLNLDAGDKISIVHEPPDPAAARKYRKDIIKNGYLNLDDGPDGHFPLAIYYHNGLVMVDVRPHDFPRHPALHGLLGQL